MKVTAAHGTVEVPSLNLVLNEGEETAFPSLKDPGARELYAQAIRKEPKEVTEKDVEEVISRILANPEVRIVGVQQGTVPDNRKEKSVRGDLPSDEGAQL